MLLLGAAFLSVCSPFKFEFRSSGPHSRTVSYSSDTSGNLWTIMSGGGEYPYPKYTWSPAGGWWAKTKNWQRKTGMAIVVVAAAAVPLALFSSANHIKFPAEERRKL